MIAVDDILVNEKDGPSILTWRVTSFECVLDINGRASIKGNARFLLHGTTYIFYKNPGDELYSVCYGVDSREYKAKLYSPWEYQLLRATRGFDGN